MGGLLGWVLWTTSHCEDIPCVGRGSSSRSSTTGRGIPYQRSSVSRTYGLTAALLAGPPRRYMDRGTATGAFHFFPLAFGVTILASSSRLTPKSDGKPCGGVQKTCPP